MQEHIKLTREQVIFLCFLGVIGNIVYIHTWIDDFTDRAAWVAAFSGVMLLIPLAIWIFYLGKFYPQGTIFDILESGLGKIASKTLRLVFILVNIAVAVAQLNMFTQMLNVFFLQYTPAWVIMLVLTMIGVLFANGGIQSFGRLAVILGVLGILNFFAAFIFAFPNFVHLEYIVPVFDTSLIGFIKGTVFVTGGTAECLLLLMIIVSYVPDPGKHYMWAVKGIALSAVVLSSAILIIIALMSPELAKRIAFGGVNAARLIQVGTFIQGLEIFILASYQFIAIGKITSTMYCSWISGTKIITGKKPFLQLVIIALIILIPSVWLTSYNKAYFLAVALGSYIILPFSLVILLLASISVVIINKRAGSAAK